MRLLCHLSTGKVFHITLNSEEGSFNGIILADVIISLCFLQKNNECNRLLVAAKYCQFSTICLLENQ